MGRRYFYLDGHDHASHDWFGRLWWTIFYQSWLATRNSCHGYARDVSQIVWTYVFEMAFLHEPINAWSVARTVLILGFMVLVGVIKMKMPPVAGVHESIVGEPETAALLFSTSRNVKRDVQQAMAQGEN